ncbi:MAG: glycosyltransferase family 29 protein [Heliobacteriaceae bacterium]|jgi:hypothetical protein|nr:glycosyltransferase family 29 protein [Heliobacteriaceae bacterium]
MKKVLQNIFSIKNEQQHKVLRVLGVKLKIRKKRKTSGDLINEKFKLLVDFTDSDIKYEPSAITAEIFANSIGHEPFDDNIARSYFLRAMYKHNLKYTPEEYVQDFKEAVFNCSFANRKYIDFWATQAHQNQMPNFKEDFEILLNKYSITELGWFAVSFYALSPDNEQRVSKIIQDIKSSFPEYELWHFPALCRICVENKIFIDERTTKAAKIFEIMQKTDENTFIDFVKDKNVAVVGNSPCEKGLKKGKDIDAHDIVIRFNNFSTDAEYSEDYGQKTDIWCRVVSSDQIFREISDDTKMVILPSKLCYFELWDIIDRIIDWDKAGVPIGWFPMHVTQELKQNYGIMRASAGIKMIYWMKKIKKDLNPQDFFGFAFTDQLENWNNRHYFKLKNETLQHIGLNHNWHSEKRVFDELVNKIIQEDTNA